MSRMMFNGVGLFREVVRAKRFDQVPYSIY